MDSLPGDKAIWGDQDEGEPLVCPDCHSSLWIFFHARDGRPIVMTAQQRQWDIERRRNLPPNRPAAMAGWPKF
jgi:hypothetical protein